jgi:hypothetical protein
LIRVHVRLRGILRDKLPEEAKGRTTLELPAGSPLNSLDGKLQTLGIRKPYRIARNGAVTNHDDTILLEDSDQIDVFRSASGG